MSLNNLHATHARAGSYSRLFWREFPNPLGIVEILHTFYPIALVLIARRRSTRAQELQGIIGHEVTVLGDGTLSGIVRSSR